MQVVVHDSKTIDGDGEDPGQQFQPLFDRLLAVLKALAAEKGSPHAARAALAAASGFQSHQLPPAVNGHGNRS